MLRMTLLVVIGGIMTATASALPMGGADSPALYKNTALRDISYKSYDSAMSLWKCAFTDEWVDTAYGKTHIVVSGPVGAKPLFLFPGLFADATMWYANSAALSEKYRVYALDMINYGGKSEPSEKPVRNIQDYKEWFTEILDHYSYKKTAVAGLSYGSFVALSLSREMPETIEALVLLDPSETFMPMDGGIAWRGFWAFVFFPNRAKYLEFFDWMGGGYTDPDMEIWAEHLLNVVEYGSLKMNELPMHGVYKPEELETVTMDVLILCGGKPIVYKDPKQFVINARNALPHAEIELVPDTGHGLNMEKPEIVNGRILEFLGKVYR
jgi:pimeloyl-ACP methyl ester carboxylesterase